MRRLVAYALVQALAVSAATGATLHVHEYLGHDHPEHHHLPAVHEHHRSAPAEGYHPAPGEDHGVPAVQAVSCDPGLHAVAVTIGCAQVPQIDVGVAELPGPSIPESAATIDSAATVTDVRVHGPPFDPRIPARAPPPTSHV